jgi:hypothetical protein
VGNVVFGYLVSSMSARSIFLLGIINTCFMSVVFFYGFSAGKEHDRQLLSLKQDTAQIRYPIERFETARPDESALGKSGKSRAR